MSNRISWILKFKLYMGGGDDIMVNLEIWSKPTMPAFKRQHACLGPKFLVVFLSVCLLSVSLPSLGIAAEGRITINELKAKMDNGEDIVILDVRTSKDYLDSNVKIKGAVRIDPDSIERKYKVLPKDKEIITYCT